MQDLYVEHLRENHSLSGWTQNNRLNLKLAKPNINEASSTLLPGEADDFEFSFKALNNNLATHLVSVYLCII